MSVLNFNVTQLLFVSDTTDKWHIEWSVPSNNANIEQMIIYLQWEQSLPSKPPVTDLHQNDVKKEKKQQKTAASLLASRGLHMTKTTRMSNHVVFY